MKDAQGVDGEQHTAVEIPPRSVAGLNGSMKHSSISAFSDSYCTAAIYYSSAPRTSSDRHDECTVSERREAIVHNNSHIDSCTGHKMPLERDFIPYRRTVLISRPPHQRSACLLFNERVN